MTREQAIGVLRCQVIFACERALFDMTTIKCVKDALDMAIEALEESERRWVPCCERPPKKKGMYFVSVNNHVVMDMWNGVGWWTTRPTAWMPLLKPYRGERNETD